MGQENSKLRRKVPDTGPSSQQIMSNATAGTMSTGSAMQPNFKWMEGRKYQDVEGAPYFLPSDEQEMDRNIMSNASSCIYDGSYILDVGCGPGTWILDLATEHPEVKFFGVDIARMFPADIKPPNIMFMSQVNILDGLPFETGKFDFVQMRQMNLAILKEDWPHVISEIYRVLKPGGYIQLLEIGGKYVTKDPEAKNFVRKAEAFVAARGQDPHAATKLASLIKKAGFQLIQHEARSIPLGWNGPLGDVMLDDLRQSTIASKPTLAAALGMESLDFDKYIDDVLDGFKKSESFVNGCVAVGQKPNESQPDESQ
ncbi:S-adenosyl-L-methionine-dependent methyltransferase [Jimgerdemannia flammicorona]|nr:S-adenosyl-L-methionine-dependent methyltransferase [Jimgerdemannia flammicorona]